MFSAFLILLFLRPFIASSAFPFVNALYTISLLTVIVLCQLKGNYSSLAKASSLRYPIIFFILALIISATFSCNKIYSLKELSQYCLSLLIFFTCGSSSEQDKEKIIKNIIFAAIMISILAIYQYICGFNHLSGYLIRHNVTNQFALDYIQHHRAFIPFVTPNLLGSYLIVVISLTLTKKDKWHFTILFLFALLLTQSLGAVVSLAVGISIYVCIAEMPLKRKFLIVLLLACIPLAVLLTRLTTVKEHLLLSFSLRQRLQYWQETLTIIAKHPYFGIGLGALNIPLSHYVHNAYLQLWAEIGIVGLSSFLWLVIIVLSKGIKTLKTSSRRHHTVGLLIAVIVFLVHNTVDFSFFVPEVSFIWWTLLGMLYASYPSIQK